MGQVVGQTLVFLLIIAGGYSLKHVHFFKEDDFRLIAKLVIYFTVPCAIISSFGRLTMDLSMLCLILLGIAANVILMTVGYFCAFKAGNDQKAFNIINYSGYNFGSFTLPYLQAFFHPAALVAACMVDAGNSLFCTGGSYAIAGWFSNLTEEKRWRSVVRRVFSSVPCDVYIVMILLAVLHISIPAWLLSFTDVVGSANSFLCMLMIGMSLQLPIKAKRCLKLVGLILVRYFVSAGMAVLVWIVAPLPEEMKGAIALVLLSPFTSLNVVFTEKINGDTQLSSQAASLSIVVSTIVITCLIPMLPIG